MKKKSITVTQKQDAWIQAQIATGHYASDSEVVREALREKAARTAEIEAIRAKLIAAEESGFSEKSVDEIWDAVREQPKG